MSSLNLTRFVWFFCVAIRLHSSFRFGSSYGNKSAKFSAFLSTTASTFQAPPELSVFDDVSVDLETSTYVSGTFTGMERVVLTANGNLQRILSAYYGAPVTVQIKKCVEVGNNTFDREVDLLARGQVVCTAVGQISIYNEECLKAIRDQKIGVGQLLRHFKTMPSFKLLRAGRRLVDIHNTHNTHEAYNVLDTAYIHDNIHTKPGEDSSVDSLGQSVSTNSHKEPTIHPDESATVHDTCNGGKDNNYSIWREYELSNQHMHCRFVERFPPGFLSFGSS